MLAGPMPTFLTSLRARGVLAAFSLSLLAVAAHAQALPGGGEFGMSAQQLHEAIPALARVPRPVRMAGGLVGQWRGPAVQVGGVAVAPTYFLAEGLLKRVEYIADSPDAYASLLAWGRATWGQELASQGSEGAYAAWTTGATQAYLQLSADARAPVRLVVKLLAAREASEL